MSYDYSTGRVQVVPFTGSFTLKSEDIGKLFRCDDTANVTVTVPPDLHSGFSAGFLQYSTGTVTLVAANNASNKSGKTALSSQYQGGSILVTKRSGGDFGVIVTNEFVVGGDFA
ncbi:hypothetical protein [Bradyrhizobium monzae]|uniref:hypothetical protein n=1 Tax=Bradyrhizobium sp. Oc8 TaxID=2876780 RepID=UPI001F27119D|nr:hypothetical protein [Bradyrhizobium sp. Oc8]